MAESKFRQVANGLLRGATVAGRRISRRRAPPGSAPSSTTAPTARRPISSATREARELAATNGLDYVFVPVVVRPDGAGRRRRLCHGARRPRRPLSRLLPLGYPLLPHVGPGDGRRAPVEETMEPRPPRQATISARPDRSRAPGGRQLRLSGRSAGRTAPERQRQRRPERHRRLGPDRLGRASAKTSPSSAASNNTHGKPLDPSQAPAAANSLASPSPSPSRPRHRR